MFLPVELKCMEASMFNSFKLGGKVAKVARMLEDEKHMLPERIGIYIHLLCAVS